MLLKYRSLLWLALPLILTAGVATAQTAGTDGDAGYGWSAGAAGAVFSTPFKDAKDVASVLPYVAYDGERFSASLFGASYRLVDSGPISVSAIATPRFQLIEPKESQTLAGMGKRDSTIEGGLQLAYGGDFGDVKLEALTDLMGKHKGSQVSLTYAYGFQAGKLSVLPHVGVTWQDAKLTNYYYGVRADEALPGRPAYKARAAAIATAGVNLSYPVSDKIRLVALMSWEALPKPITDSPIVDDKSTATLIVGAIRRF